MASGVSMVIFLLRDKAMIDLAGKQSCICHRIEHQTERAVLLAVIHKLDGEEKKNASYWLPKSQILIDNQKPEGMIDLAAAGKSRFPNGFGRSGGKCHDPRAATESRISVYKGRGKV